MTDSVRSIALVGLPGAGKTTVGRLLAAELGWTFFDCDATFEAEVGSGIADWVTQRGWRAFRVRESKILAEALACGKRVIATGGGVVEDEKNRTALVAAAVVWLDAPLEVLTARLATSHRRPLLGKDATGLAELSVRREAWYRKVADLEITAIEETPRQLAARILNDLRRF